VAYCGRALKGEDVTLIFPKDFDPEGYLFNAHQVTGPEIVLVRDPLDALIAMQNGIDNVVSVLTQTVSADQLRMLASLMDDIGAGTVELY